MVEHSAVNRGVVGSSPTRGVLIRRDSADLFSSASTTLPWNNLQAEVIYNTTLQYPFYGSYLQPYH